MWNVYVIALLSLYAPSHKNMAAIGKIEICDSRLCWGYIETVWI